MTWHQFWSSSSVVTTMSARAAPRASGPTVTMAVRAPAAAGRKRGVRGGRRALVRDADDEAPARVGRARVRRPGRGRGSRLPAGGTSASRNISTTASGACSDVPQPVTRIGSPGGMGRAGEVQRAPRPCRGGEWRTTLPRRGRAPPRSSRSCGRAGRARELGRPVRGPRVGRAGERGVGIEGDVVRGGGAYGRPRANVGMTTRTV